MIAERAAGEQAPQFLPLLFRGNQPDSRSFGWLVLPFEEMSNEDREAVFHFAPVVSRPGACPSPHEPGTIQHRFHSPITTGRAIMTANLSRWELAAENIAVKIRWFGILFGYLLVNLGEVVEHSD